MKYQLDLLLFFVLIFSAIALPDGVCPVTGLAQEYRLGAVTANVNLRKTPSLQGEIVAGLQKGSPIKVYGEKDGWYRVSAKKNYILFDGWVFKRFVDIVSTAALPAPPETPLQPEPPIRPLPLVTPAPEMETAPETEKVAAVEDPEPKPAPEEKSAPSAPQSSQTLSAPKETRPAPSAGLGGNIRLLLSISPLVLAVIALLIAVRAFRATRGAPGGPKPAETGASPPVSEPEPVRPSITPEKPPVNEKRRAPRLDRLIEVDFSVNGRFFRGFINNLSESGVYVDTPESFSVGQGITIACPAIDTGGYVKRDGMIIRLTETGIAVHFQQSDLP